MAFLDALGVDGSRLTAECPGQEHLPLWGSALVVDEARSDVLSSERMSISYGPTAEVNRSSNSLGMARVAQNGPVGLARLSQAADADRLPPETAVGYLDGSYFTAYSLFYRPFNQLPDVEAHYSTLKLAESDIGLVCDPTFEVITERFASSLPQGGLTVTRPQGTPADSYEQTSAGKVWVDTTLSVTRVILENDQMHISVAPWHEDGSPRDPSSDAVAAAWELLRSVTSAAWTEAPK
jgi:hypothetical protein